MVSPPIGAVSLWPSARLKCRRHGQHPPPIGACPAGISPVVVAPQSQGQIIGSRADGLGQKPGAEFEVGAGLEQAGQSHQNISNYYWRLSIGLVSFGARIC
jgi:hypothetical protein